MIKISILISTMLLGLTAELAAKKLPLHNLILPDGFKVSVFAREVRGAQQLVWGDAKVLFVGTKADKVYALPDRDSDGKADEILELASHLNSPSGVAYLNGDLYVAEIHRLTQFPAIESNLKKIKKISVRDDFPIDGWHGRRHLAISPSQSLYMSIGSPCNDCKKSNPIYGTIIQMDPIQGPIKIHARGIRNSLGLAFHPSSNALWFTDTGRDFLGENCPPDELNTIRTTWNTPPDFGFPYRHGEDKIDPKMGDHPSPNTIQPPALELTPNAEAQGICFYTGNTFPDTYKNTLFIAKHGSWNTAEKKGYQIMQVDFNEKERPTRYRPFISGWVINDRVWGRPVDIVTGPDGSLYISDDFAHVIYRVSYTKKE